MAFKAFSLLATLALVSLPTSATVQQQQEQQEQAEQQCVTRADFESVVAQIAAIESSHNIWRNATLHILKKYLPANPGKVICAGHWW